MENHFNLKKQMTNCDYSNFGIWQPFFKNDPSESVTSKNKIKKDSICCNNKIHSFKQKSTILENLNLTP